MSLFGEVSWVFEILTPTYKVQTLTPCPKEPALLFEVVLTVFMKLFMAMCASQTERAICYVLMG